MLKDVEPDSLWYRYDEAWTAYPNQFQCRDCLIRRRIDTSEHLVSFYTARTAWNRGRKMKESERGGRMKRMTRPWSKQKRPPWLTSATHFSRWTTKRGGGDHLLCCSQKATIRKASYDYWSLYNQSNSALEELKSMAYNSGYNPDALPA